VFFSQQQNNIDRNNFSILLRDFILAFLGVILLRLRIFHQVSEAFVAGFLELPTFNFFSWEKFLLYSPQNCATRILWFSIRGPSKTETARWKSTEIVTERFSSTSFGSSSHHSLSREISSEFSFDILMNYKNIGDDAKSG
jgi:hypothetical protein